MFFAFISKIYPNNYTTRKIVTLESRVIFSKKGKGPLYEALSKSVTRV